MLGQKQKQSCSLCLKQINKGRGYEGRFDRVCKKCWTSQNQSYWDPINYIDEGIFLGNQEASLSKDILEEHGIQAICNCGEELKNAFEGDYEYKQYKIEDFSTEKVIDYLDENYPWLQQKVKENKKVLIHCKAGMSRSATFTIAFMMKFKNMSAKDAYSFVKGRRLCVEPHQNFMNEIFRYEKHLKSKN